MSRCSNNKVDFDDGLVHDPDPEFFIKNFYHCGIDRIVKIIRDQRCMPWQRLAVSESF